MSLIKAQGAGDASTGLYGFTIDQSLRLEDGDSPSLKRDQSSTTSSSDKAFTFSCWVKRGNFGSYQTLLGTEEGGDREYFGFMDTHYFIYQFNNGTNLISNRVFRDVASWYHIVVAVNINESTAADRQKIYVNGSQLTSFSSANYYGSGDTVNFMKSGIETRVGGLNSSYANSFNGYLAEVHFVDGSALAPTSFGETKAGIWIPKQYTGSHGNNGFYLPFDDSGAIGDDESANTNDFTVTNITATDVVPDSPTNNFAVIANDKGGTSQGYTEGNLHANQDGSGGGSYAAKATMLVPMDSGKWYVEALADTADGSGAGLGTYTSDSINRQGTIAYYYNGNIVVADDIIHYYSDGENNGQIYQDGQQQSGLAAAGDKGIIGMLVDTDAKTVQFYVNGSAAGTAVSMNNTTDFVGAQLHGHNTRPFMFNFGQDSSFADRKTSGSANAQDANGIGDFYYTPPTNAKAFCTANLPDPAIDPAQDEEPADYFDIQLWTGTGSGQSFSNFSFQPDWLWFKNRNGGSDHAIFDSIRGVNAGLTSHSTSAENTNASGSQDLVSFDNDGFTTGTPSQYGSLGSNTLTIVTWAWLAGGSASSNTDGGITSSVSANTESGFSIVSYSGTGSITTVGHGLNSAPEMIIIKNRNSNQQWPTYVKGASATAGAYLLLNRDLGVATDDSMFNNVNPTSTVFTVTDADGDTGRSGSTYIAYCFHSVDGYSKIGSYTGNGNADGPFIYTGFRPAWVMIKRTNGSGNWVILDNKREGFNPDQDGLDANGAGAEGTAEQSDLLSTGFKVRNNSTGSNGSGSTFIYLAFAEQPFKYSNAR